MELTDTGLPIDRPCLSFWQRTTRHSHLINCGSANEDKLPDYADAVVIGSGLSGALTAFELLSAPGGPKKVVMLEAREACSGATGRNAGHCRPDAFRGFVSYSKIHGTEQAMKILKHEKLVLQLLKDFVEKHNIDCDFHYCKTYEVIMSEEFRQYAKASFDAFEKGGGNTEGIHFLGAEEAQKETRVPLALGAVEWQAASLHPAKLCYAILSKCQAVGLSLFTHTPVIPVTSASSPNALWSVKTSGGSIRTPIVVHATNAFASTLLPSLSSALTPWRAQAHKMIPPSPKLVGSNMLTHSYSLRFSLRHFYSIIQRPADGAIVLGTSAGIPGNDGMKTRKGNTDDSSWDREIGKDAIKNFETSFGLNEKAKAFGEGHEFGWTGIVGMTFDTVPLIGSVPNLAGQFVIAGFNGHGMARIFGCAPGLVKMIMGGSWSDTGMPECFQITEERLKQALG